ncbi:MAG: hypothetical protein JSW27_07865 [Phycisphaerales bacterium]|nr:MAG: hypothetical protein JSW27_07865 [Phycisphaerales bacterium]
MRQICFIAGAVLLCTSLMAGAAWSQEASATLVVEAANGTADGATVVGDLAILRIFHQQQLQNTLEAKVGESGEAVFEDVPTGQHLVAVARVKHQNMTFQGSPTSLVPETDNYSTVVQVFDVSADTSALSVGTHHVMIAVENAMLEVIEYMQLQNDSDMAVRGSQRDAQDRPMVVEIMLPNGATDLRPLSFLQASVLVTTETGFYDTLAVPPGEHQVKFSYRIDIDHQALDFAKAISLPTSELVVFWEEGQGELTGLGEPDERLANAQGVPVEYYRRHNLQPGDEIAFRISGFNVKTSDADTWIALAVAFAIVLAIALWRLRPGSSPPVPVD